MSRESNSTTELTLNGCGFVQYIQTAAPECQIVETFLSSKLISPSPSDCFQISNSDRQRKSFKHKALSLSAASCFSNVAEISSSERYFRAAGRDPRSNTHNRLNLAAKPQQT